MKLEVPRNERGDVTVRVMWKGLGISEDVDDSASSCWSGSLRRNAIRTGNDHLVLLCFTSV